MGLSLGPRGTEIASAHQMLKHRTRDAEICRQLFCWRTSGRLFVPSASNPATKVDAAICIDSGFQAVVDKFILLAHPATDRVGHSTGCPAIYPAGDCDPDRRVMSNAGVHPSEYLDQSAIFARVHRWYATRALECGDSDGQAGTRRFSMARPWVGRVGIVLRRDLIKQIGQLTFQGIVRMQMRWNERCFGGIDHCPSTHQVGSCRQRHQVTLDPIVRDNRIGIGRQQSPAGASELSGMLHDQPACVARVGDG